MKIKVEKQALQNALSKIQNIIEETTTTPVLTHFLLDVADTGSYIFATDLETAVKLPVKAEVFEAGKACIPGKKFYEIVKELGEEVELTLSDSWLKIQSGRSTFKLATLPAEEFPRWTDITDAVKIDVSRDLLLTAVEKTLYAAGEADVRYVLNTLLFHLKPGELHVVGTDGHRLAHFKAEVDYATEETLLILSKKSLNELKKFLSDAETVSVYVGSTHVAFEMTVSVYVGSTHVAFEMDGVKFLTRLIEGNYPEYEVVIPRNNPNEVVLDRDSFVSALRRVSVLSRDKMNAVRVELRPDVAIVSTSNSELGEAKDEVPITLTGNSITMAFNAEFLIDALKGITSSSVKFTFSEPEKAVYITDIGVNSFVYECVIMPLRW
ncbi:DNA polymerase III subunit beta [Thermodesulfovibrio yellowstonii]|uniref:DNA polymerase III subunit beta n=1 Tax=Thermodesulfovibrio yellowstonii TaxID=28262 RepID=UPI00040F1AE6|nr:DNA polymerase III subunit beta [Thermodesulfovibrio islandicus]